MQLEFVEANLSGIMNTSQFYFHRNRLHMLDLWHSRIGERPPSFYFERNDRLLEVKQDSDLITFDLPY